MTSEVQRLELDYIGELLNLGMGKVAGQLIELAGAEVRIGVPDVKILARNKAKAWLGLAEDASILATWQTFGGSFEGNAVLLCTEADSKKLVAELLNNGEAQAAVTRNQEEEFLSKMSSIIVDGVLSTVSDILSVEVKETAPVAARGAFGEILAPWFDKDDENHMALYLTVGVAVVARGVSVTMVFLQELDSADHLLSSVQAYLESEGFA